MKEDRKKTHCSFLIPRSRGSHPKLLHIVEDIEDISRTPGASLWGAECPTLCVVCYIEGKYTRLSLYSWITAQLDFIMLLLDPFYYRPSSCVMGKKDDSLWTLCTACLVFTVLCIYCPVCIILHFCTLLTLLCICALCRNVYCTDSYLVS